MLEDLHWSDVSTLEWLSYMVRRQELAKFLIIGTYRPADVIASGHPLKGVVQELQAQGQCQDLQIGPLQEAEVSEYLKTRFAQSSFPASLSHTVHQRTGGNPLFVVNVIDYLTQQRVITESAGRWSLQDNPRGRTEADIPDNLRQLIERQIDRLGADEQHLLEIASIVGVEFCAAAVATGLQVELEIAEGQCEGLVRRGQFIVADEAIEEWPDSTLSGRYHFVHALHHDVFYQRVAPSRLVQLHRKIGARKAAAYGERSGEIAAELAMHFERGRDIQQAVHYMGQAGENAIRRSANVEAVQYLTEALSLLKMIPESLDRQQQELFLRVALGIPLTATQGLAAPAVEQTYARARKLCQQLGETPHIFPVLVGLNVFYTGRGDIHIVHELAEQCLRLAENAHDPDLLLEAHLYMGNSLFWLGDLQTARQHFEQTIALYNPQQHRAHAFVYGQDPGVVAKSELAWTLWMLGYPEHALQCGQESLTLARENAHAHSTALALSFATLLYGLCGDWQKMQLQAEETVSFATEYELLHWLGFGILFGGVAMVEQGDLRQGRAQMLRGDTVYRATGAELGMVRNLSLLADVSVRAGEIEEGQRFLAESHTLCQRRGEAVWEAELCWLEGKILLNQAP